MKFASLNEIKTDYNDFIIRYKTLFRKMELETERNYYEKVYRGDYRNLKKKHWSRG